jgi:uncharacterized protein YkwD
MAHDARIKFVRWTTSAVLAMGLLAAVTRVNDDDRSSTTVAVASAPQVIDVIPKSRPTPRVLPTTTTTAPPTTVAPVVVEPVVEEASVPTTRAPRPTTTTTEAPPPEPPPTEPPPPPPPPVTTVLAAAEQTILGLVNSVRSVAGLGGLSVSGHMTSVARQWAQTMAANGSLTHNPSYFSQILQGVDCSTVAENIAYRRPGDAAAVHAQLMASAGHAANVLDGSFSLIGVGAVTDADGTLWVVQNFCG